ncbi:MAG: hypothetical protein RBT76_06860 [candidate division Zixibacteria bacterium]|nr:hypothetical protein [candidate division Zixibacteria bacterium]
MSDLNLYSVNWQDGMLISQQHLKDQETYFRDLVRWHTLSVGDQFGLVKKAADKPSLSMNFSVVGSRVRVEITRCQALTPDCHYVEINESNRSALFAETSLTESVIPVWLVVSPGSRKPVGDPDPNEAVPRMPYLVSACELHLGKKPAVPEGNLVQIAQLQQESGELAPAAGYYPPCLTISADEQLAAKAVDLRNRMENLLSLASRAYSAIATAGALSDQSTSLQVAFKETMYHFGYHLAASLDQFTVGRNAGHPLEMVVFFKRLFRVFTTLLNFRPGLKDYLNERFFIKEQKSDVGRFMSSVDSFLLADYNHRDIGSQVKMIDATVTTLRSILGFLAQLKREQLGEQAVATDALTYGGKTYRIAPYDSAATERVGELSYLMVKFQAPRPINDTVILMSKQLFSIAEWNNMQVRIGLNEARGLGETDPVDVDAVTYGDKVALHAMDMLQSPSVAKITLIFRGAREAEKLVSLAHSDLFVYAV